MAATLRCQRYKYRPYGSNLRRIIAIIRTKVVRVAIINLSQKCRSLSLSLSVLCLDLYPSFVLSPHSLPIEKKNNRSICYLKKGQIKRNQLGPLAMQSWWIISWRTIIKDEVTEKALQRGSHIWPFHISTNHSNRVPNIRKQRWLSDCRGRVPLRGHPIEQLTSS